MTTAKNTATAAPLPALFISHGAPDLILGDRPAAQWFRALGEKLPRPERIIAVSAHWITDPVAITGADRPPLIYDFYGFPDPLYDMEYPAPGDPALAAKVQTALRRGGIKAVINLARGFDHGAWAPLKMIYPEADIPTIQVSLPHDRPDQLAEIGAALRTLRDDKTLIIGSGATVHNLKTINLRNDTAPWALAFEEWLLDAVEHQGFEQVADPANWPADFATAHPTAEHFMPLLVAWAAGDRSRPGRRIFSGFDYGNIGMSCFAFGEDAPDL